jgi:roadblock/LC7 domain-containing protein
MRKEKASVPATLDDLIKIDGVTIAFEFTPDGNCTGFRAKDGSPEMAAMVSRFCATVTMLFDTLARSFTTLSQEQRTPQRGWIDAGGDHTVAIGGGG